VHINIWIHREAGKYHHKVLPYNDLLKELVSGVGAYGKFARTGAIESEAERDEAALRAGLEAEETVELEQAGEDFGVQSE